MKIKNTIRVGLIALVLSAIGGFGGSLFLRASDHDDGEVDTKGRNLNLTDLYVFRERDQNPNAAEGDLVFIMNSNPRSVARQQYYFSSTARYEFKVTRIANNDAAATGQSNVVLRFEFSPPNPRGQQNITVTAIRDGATATAQNLRTTPLNTAPIANQVSLGGSTLSVFAGLREDPFFFDVEQFFRVRAGLAGIGPSVGFRSPGLDFTGGYNVNTIAVRVPRQFLQAGTPVTTFDVWQTISARRPDGTYAQVERLARPAVNEGLVLTNDFLNALNGVGPDFEAAALAGQQPAARIAGPIVGEAKRTLLALGNSDARATSLLGAFLPDVMRIDTTQPSGYGNALNGRGSPIRGRLIRDDVIDITLSVLSNGAVTSDNVSYDGPNLGGRGHKPVLGAFPYVPEPN
ncbi:DUF4331 domain-containing protein [Argonema galeatum]|uniref:DUF4331 domain-containing protein n=1 Tax=Argonema galeatum TaxID=2942762 RepID=UPI002012CD91|nr:DUF4331 domain-containing protein [Argonema galeatum]MCL1466670.1 DUF4331 domain-containing protein [Argonema galeatum A003/A1]